MFAIGVALSLSVLHQAVARAPATLTDSLATLAANQQIAVLQAQLDLMRQYDQRIMATVYWSLGLTATLAAILIGFGWYANFRLYERDKKALTEELQAVLKGEIKTLHGDVDNRLSAIAESARKAGQGPAEAVRSELKTLAENLQRELDDIRYELLEAEARRWREAGVHANEIDRYAQMLHRAMKVGYDWRVSEVLDKLQSTLKDLSTGKRLGSLGADTIHQVTEAIDALPASYGVAKTDVLRLLGDIRATQG